MTYELHIFDTETGADSEVHTFDSDAEAEGAWNLISENYPENYDFYIVWKE